MTHAAVGGLPTIIPSRDGWRGNQQLPDARARVATISQTIVQPLEESLSGTSSAPPIWNRQLQVLVGAAE